MLCVMVNGMAADSAPWPGDAGGPCLLFGFTLPFKAGPYGPLQRCGGVL